MNINCIICSDLFVPSASVFTTPCGHLFHHACIIQWMERKKDCPQCRQKCTERNIFRIYFNTTSTHDSSTNCANLLETVDTLTLKVREQDIGLKKSVEERDKLEDSLKTKEKKLKKLEGSVAQLNQVISTMKHEIDILSSHRATVKAIEAENRDMKSKLNLLQTIESVLTASQREIDDIVKQNLSSKDLAVMVGTLRRELNNTEMRKNDLRKQLQSIRNDLRSEQEEKRKMQDELSKLESDNNLMMNKFKRLKTAENIEQNNCATPDPIRKSLKPINLDCQNQTPSPMNNEELKKRIQTIQESDSPYFKVKKSSIALACTLKHPKLVSTGQRTFQSEKTSKLSILKKPRLCNDPFPKLNNAFYNGIGGTSKVLQSDLVSRK